MSDPLNTVAVAAKNAPPEQHTVAPAASVSSDPFTYVLSHLLSDNSPLALGFAGAIMAIVLFAASYLALSKMGMTGDGEVRKRMRLVESDLEAERKKNRELVDRHEEEKAGYNREILTLKIENATVRAESGALQKQLTYKTEELAEEKKQVDQWIQRIEQISGLEDRLRGGNR